MFALGIWLYTVNVYLYVVDYNYKIKKNVYQVKPGALKSIIYTIFYDGDSYLGTHTGMIGRYYYVPVFMYI